MSLKSSSFQLSDFTIRPKTGFGNIMIGMSRGEIEELIGRPEEFKAEYTESKPVKKDHERWIFEMGLDLVFYAEDGFLLSAISVSKSPAYLDGVDVLELSEQQLIEAVPDVVLEDDFEEFGRDYVCKDKELSFWVVEKKVSSLTIFSEYTKDGNSIIWPLRRDK